MPVLKGPTVEMNLVCICDAVSSCHILALSLPGSACTRARTIVHSSLPWDLMSKHFTISSIAVSKTAGTALPYLDLMWHLKASLVSVPAHWMPQVHWA